MGTEVLLLLKLITAKTVFIALKKHSILFSSFQIKNNSVTTLFYSIEKKVFDFQTITTTNKETRKSKKIIKNSIVTVLDQSIRYCQTVDSTSIARHFPFKLNTKLRSSLLQNLIECECVSSI